MSGGAGSTASLGRRAARSARRSWPSTPTTPTGWRSSRRRRSSDRLPHRRAEAEVRRLWRRSTRLDAPALSPRARHIGTRECLTPDASSPFFQGERERLCTSNDRDASPSQDAVARRRQAARTAAAAQRCRRTSRRCARRSRSDGRRRRCWTRRGSASTMPTSSGATSAFRSSRAARPTSASARCPPSRRRRRTGGAAAQDEPLGDDQRHPPRPARPAARQLHCELPPFIEKSASADPSRRPASCGAASTEDSTEVGARARARTRLHVAAARVALRCGPVASGGRRVFFFWGVLRARGRSFRTPSCF